MAGEMPAMSLLLMLELLQLLHQYIGSILRNNIPTRKNKILVNFITESHFLLR